MAYSTDNPPVILAQSVRGEKKIWAYQSTDAATAVRVSGYITNGFDLGMRAGDTVFVTDTDASPIATQVMIVTSATRANGVDLSDGTAIVATDTD